MPVNWDDFDYFDRDEFDDPLHPGSGDKISPAVVLLLDNLRKRAGIPIITHNKYGVRGCVCVDEEGHSSKSLHYVSNGATAVDWHFDTDMDIRDQAKLVLRTGFGGIGIYYDWEWPDCPGGKLKIGFHTDVRKRFQVWKREYGNYIYLLK